MEKKSAVFWGPLRDSNGEEIIFGLCSGVWDHPTSTRNACKDQLYYLCKALNKEDRQNLGNVTKGGKHWAKGGAEHRKGQGFLFIQEENSNESRASLPPRWLWFNQRKNVG